MERLFLAALVCLPVAAYADGYTGNFNASVGVQVEVGGKSQIVAETDANGNAKIDWAAVRQCAKLARPGVFGTSMEAPDICQLLMDAHFGSPGIFTGTMADLADHQGITK